MSYIELINAFERWLETNYLPGLAQLLWYKLIHIFNRAGWCEWITVDNYRLMALLDVKREATFISHRDKLIDVGLFEYQKGKKGSPNRYKICTAVFESTNSSKSSSINSSINSSKSVVQNVANTVGIYRLRQDKEKDKEEKITATVTEVIAFYEQNIGFPSPILVDLITDLCRETSPELVVEAIKIAVKSNKKNSRYIEGILKNWVKKGFKTLIDIKNEEENFKKSKQGTSLPMETEEERQARRVRELEEAIKIDDH